MRGRGGKSKLCVRTGSVLQFHGRIIICYRIMVRSCSNRQRIVNDTSTVFGKFLLDLGVRFCVAGAAFGDVAVPLFVGPRIVNDFSRQVHAFGQCMQMSLSVAGAVFGEFWSDHVL